MLKSKRFNYGVEYLVYTPNEGNKAYDLLLINQIYPARINKDFVGIVNQFYMVNALRMSPYRFFDTIVKKVDSNEEWENFKVVRALDECELIEIENNMNIPLLKKYDPKNTDVK